jgi:hypothetical protein
MPEPMTAIFTLALAGQWQLPTSFPLETSSVWAVAETNL